MGIVPSTARPQKISSAVNITASSVAATEKFIDCGLPGELPWWSNGRMVVCITIGPRSTRGQGVSRAQRGTIKAPRRHPGVMFYDDRRMTGLLVFVAVAQFLVFLV